MKIKRHFLPLVIFSLFLTLGFQTLAHAETDVTGSVGLVKSALAYNRANKTSYLDVSVRNTGTDPLLTPLKVVIDSISTPAVTVANADGVTSDGKPYFQYSFANALSPNQLTTAKRWIFSNPTQARFSYTVKAVGSVSYLRINGMNPSAALPGETMTLTFSGDSGVRPIQVVLSSLTVDTVVVSGNTATFKVPAGEQTGPLFLSQGGRVSNSIILNISDIRVVTPTADDLVLDEFGNQLAVNLVVVSMKTDHNTYAEASRVAALQSGTIVGNLPLIDGYQVRLPTRTLNELRAAIEVLEADPAVDFVLTDLMVKPFQTAWDNQGYPGQRESNLVIAGANLYVDSVHPTLPEEIRPKVVKIGVVENGLDFDADDFRGYAGSDPEQYRVAVSGENSHDSADHGTAVTGVIAARLGNGGSNTGRNAGLLAALEGHGGFKISVSKPGGVPGVIHATHLMLLSGHTVINWSFGGIKEGTFDLLGNITQKDVCSAKDFDSGKKAYQKLFSKIEKDYKNVVIVAAANNSCVRVEEDNVIPSGIPSPSMIVVGGNEFSSGGQPSFWNWLNTSYKAGSGYGYQVDILAASRVVRSDGGRELGTSVAAPLVTATVAAMQSINPSLTPSQIRHLLRSSAIGIDATVEEILKDPICGDKVSYSVATLPLTALEAGTETGRQGQAAVLNVEGAIQAAIDSLNPSAPVLIPPGGGSSPINPNNIEFRWQPSVDPSGYPVTYCITIKEVGVANPVYSGCDPGSNTFFQISLSPGKTYSWSVTAKDSLGFESPASSASFTTMVAYKVSGKVTSGGVGLEGVAVTLEGVGATTTDAGGNYQFIDVLEGTYNISFAKAGYTFNPSQDSIAFAGTDFVWNKEATVPPVSLNDGLVAYYPFNGNANDESGNGNHGLVSGATLTTDRFGNAGSAYYFDGNDGIIVNTGGNLDGFKSMTISAWVKSENSSTGGILSKGEYNGISHWSYELLHEKPSGGIYASLYPNDGTGAGRIEFGSTSQITNSIWNHVTYVWDSSGYVKIYINGTLDKHLISGVPTQMASTNYPLYIGRRSDPSFPYNTNWFYGSIDDIRIYNRVLSEAEVQELYSQNNFQNPGGTVSLPRTGQTRCWNNSGSEIPCTGTGQDGDIQAGVAWPNPRFSVNGDCVTDNLTGLVWAKNANLPNGTRTWQGALDYVASINSGMGLCGQHDWRLPNVNELESMVNADLPNSATWLNAQGFSNVIDVQSNFYWSSSTFMLNPNSAWAVDMPSGFVEAPEKPRNWYVWPVRSGQAYTPPAPLWKTGQTACYDTAGIVRNCSGTGEDGELRRGVAWPDPRFEVIGDCVTDNLTGLKWARNANLPNSTLTWQGALDYAASLNSGSGLCGQHDWRLPNRKELRSLVDYSQVTPAMPPNHSFINVQSGHYWSSSTNALNPNNAWIVNIWQAYLSCNLKGSGYVWPVGSGR